MRLFETIKEIVTVGQAAEYYGMKIGRTNMICCPFHNDHHPSMKLNTTYYYCFGCGATGDVIQFVASKSLICWKVQIFLMLVKIQIKLWNYCRNFFLQ